MSYLAYGAQVYSGWTSEWGGGSVPKEKHGKGIIALAGGIQSLYLTPGGSYDTFYQLLRCAPQNNALTATVHIQFQYPSDEAVALTQADEFEIVRSDGNFVIGGGVQLDYKDTKTVRTYDYQQGKWITAKPNIPATDALIAHGAVLDIVCVYDLGQSDIGWRELQINGVKHDLNITRHAVEKPGSAQYFNIAWQHDCTAAIQPNVVFVPRIDITIT